MNYVEGCLAVIGGLCVFIVVAVTFGFAVEALRDELRTRRVVRIAEQETRQAARR